MSYPIVHSLATAQISTGGSSTISQNFGFTVNGGDFLLILLYTGATDFATGVVTGTVTDGTHNYTLLIAADMWATGSDFHHVLLYLPNCPAGVNQVNLNVQSSFIVGLFIVEYSGLPANSSVVNSPQTLFVSGPTTTWGPTASYAANANDLVISGVVGYEFSVTPAQAWTPDAAFTTVLSTNNFNDGAENWGGLLQHIDAEATSGGITASASTSNSTEFFWGFIISFSGAAATVAAPEEGGTSEVMVARIQRRARSQFIA